MSSGGSSSIKRGTSSIKSPKSPRSPKIKIGSSVVSDTEIEDTASQTAPIVKKDKNALRIHLEHQEGCEYAEEFIRLVREQFPNAVFEIDTSQDDCFEYHLNDKVVYSKRILKRWPGQKEKKGGPDFEELIEITYWMEQGKSFMHMYLCSFVERRGNEDVHMAINDRRNTPFVKRAILACTIQ